jgi:GT2 family glycosyltransferase
MRVTAVVICWNPGPRVDACLAALAAQDYPDLEVIVVDNASGDGTAALVAERHPWAKLVANPENRGFAGAANQGYALSSGEAVMTVNPDVVARPTYVREMVAALETAPDVGSVAGLLLRPDGTVDSAGHQIFHPRLFRNRGEGFSPEAYQEPAWVFGTTGAAALYRRVALADAAAHDPAGTPWDEGCFAFWEDIDLDWRLARLGWRCRYTPAAVAVHERGVARRAASAFVEELNWRNRLRVIWRNDQPVAFVTHLPGFVATTLLKAGDLALTYPGALIRGTSGLRLGRRPTGRDGRVITEAFDYGRWIRSHVPASLTPIHNQPH